MYLFYSNEVQHGIARFNEVESRHLQVLRKRQGDPIQLTDGQGHLFNAEIESISKRLFSARILSKKKKTIQPKCHVHIGIAPTKNIERFEWFLEKATEIGISEITPVFCSNSERKRIRKDRLEKILLAAMKQSLKVYLPKLNEPQRFDEFVMTIETEDLQNRFIAHCHEENLPHLMGNYLKGQDVKVLVGPEGDFSKAEVETALANNFKAISLGRSRLRTETAGLAAVHIINLKNFNVS